jgi:ADP-ribose pyrophosphatase YjhB (NUDIX family)
MKLLPIAFLYQTAAKREMREETGNKVKENTTATQCSVN